MLKKYIEFLQQLSNAEMILKIYLSNLILKLKGFGWTNDFVRDATAILKEEESLEIEQMNEKEKEIRIIGIEKRLKIVDENTKTRKP